MAVSSAGSSAIQQHVGQRIIKRLKAVGHVVRNKPHVALVPLCVLGLMVGLGLWGVLRGASSYYDNARQDARWHLEAATSAMQLTIQEALTPVMQAADWVKHTHNYSEIRRNWLWRSGDWMSKKPASWFVNLKPAGILALIYPPVDPSAPYLNRDLLALNSPWRAGMLDTILANRLQVSTPIYDHGMWVTSFQLPIFVPDVAPTETFNMPWNATACPSYCYLNATRSKWWGMAGLTVDANIFISKEGPLSSLVQAGYQMQVWRPADPSTETTPKVVDNPNPLPEPSDVIKGPVPIADATWEVHIWKDNWQAPYTAGLIAAVVVASVLFSALIFSVLLSWEEHKLLLHSILPQAAIKQMRSEMHKTAGQIQTVLDNVELETPAQHMLQVIEDVINGNTPVMARVVAAQQALRRHADVYRPSYQELTTRIKGADMDKEVQRALVNQLTTADSSEMLSMAPSVKYPDHDKGSLDIVTLDSSKPSMCSNAALDLRIKSMDLATTYPWMKYVVANPEEPLPDKLTSVLATVDNWAFDAFALEEACDARPLSALAFYLFQRSGLKRFCKTDSLTLARFVDRVESGYKQNPYHNSRHAADVLQTYNVLLNRGGIRPKGCEELVLLGCFLAAIIHDYEHVGRSNDYLCATSDTLAIRYSDRSPMESHHLAAAWTLLQIQDYNILNYLTKVQRDTVRKMTIDLVLATDMKQHFATVGKFSTLKDQMAAVERSSGDPQAGLSESDKLLVLQMALKCSDLGHLAAPLQVHLKWVSELEEELFLQGDEERSRGLPISPLCDRTKEGVTKSQVGFFDFVVLPMYSKFAEAFPASQPLLDAVLSNYRYWHQQATKARESPSK